LKTPRARFPFIISFHQKNPNSGAAHFLLIQELIDELKILSSRTEEKSSLVLKKMIFLESALDEILETAEEKKIESSLHEQPQQEMEKFFKGLIPIMDSLDAAGISVAESEEHELSKGFEIINRKLSQYLSSKEFTKSAAIGAGFDPQFHEAAGTSISTMEPGLITEIIECGWMFQNKVLRFAKVIVAK